MIILCTGMMRSGSTWSYNVALNIIRLSNEVIHCGYVASDKLLDSIEKTPDDAVGIFKCHDPNDTIIQKIKNGEYKNIIMIRHPLDCIASRQSFAAREPLLKSVAWIQKNVDSVYKMMGGVPSLVIRYEEMIVSPLTHIRLIAAYLGYELSEEIVRVIHINTNIEATKAFCSTIKEGKGVIKENDHLIDLVTALHHNHIGNCEVGKWVRELGDRGEILKSHLVNEIKFLGY